MQVQRCSFVLTAALILAATVLSAQTTYQELTGFDLLPSGANGSGVIFGLVEGDTDGRSNVVAYRSNRSGITFTYQDLGSSDVTYTTSSHANTVMARYANLATGSTNVINTEAFYFYNQFLNLGISGYPTPALNQPGSDVINMSFIFGALDNTTWAAIDRRTDYLTSAWNKVVVAGVSLDGNGNLAAPASAYNVIAVAELNDAYTAPRRTNLGPTEGPNPGRANPHLLAPGTTTSNETTNNSRPSWAAPVVSAAAAVIVQAARDNAEYSAAEDARLVKSILLTGAVKLPGWDAAASTKVLDIDQGAGVVNIANSYAILTGGRTLASGSTAHGTTGWDVATVTQSPGQGGAAVATWFFDIPDASYFDLGFDLTATLAWNRDIASTLNSSTLRKLYLELFTVDGETFNLGTSVYKSDSDIDNLQHIFHTFGADETGRYALRVTGEGFGNNVSETFALTWTAVAIPEPGHFALALAALLAIITVLRRKRNRG